MIVVKFHTRCDRRLSSSEARRADGLRRSTSTFRAVIIIKLCRASAKRPHCCSSPALSTNGKREGFPSRLLSQISQLPQRDAQHRKIKVADGLKIGEHLLAASQCALVLRFPLLDERVGHFHLGAEYHN